MHKQHIINAHKKKFRKLQTYKQVVLLFDPFKTLYEWKNPNVVEFDSQFTTNLMTHTSPVFTPLNYQPLSPATTMTFSTQNKGREYTQLISTEELPPHTFSAELYK